MKAVLLTQEEIKRESLELEDERFRHLVQVTRTKVGEEFLVLDGMGQRALANILEINKRNCMISISQLSYLPCPHQLSLFVGCPKKDAVEEIIRRSVELGIKKIFFYDAKFSTWSYVKNARIDKIIESALIQSNNFWAPEIEVISTGDLSKVLAQHQRVLWLHLIGTGPVKKLDGHKIDLICIGPEAGWAQEECTEIQAAANVEILQLATPILRAEHAISVASGYALALNDI